MKRTIEHVVFAIVGALAFIGAIHIKGHSTKGSCNDSKPASEYAAKPNNHG